MHYGHSPEKAQIVAQQALSLIDKASLPRRPDIFELFYVYVSGQLPEVVRALDKIYAKPAQPNEEDCAEIYKLHVSGAAHESAMLKASEKVADTIEEVKKIVGAMQQSTSQYGENLSGVNDSLAQAKTMEDVAGIVKTMMAQTATIVERNKELESQIERSSTAISGMQGEIEAVRRESLTDGLTGLANRKHFDRRIDEAQVIFSTLGKPFSLLIMDIDHFKSFNDTYGHQVGDRVLKLLARVLQEHASSETLFPARFGGEEFVVIAAGYPLSEAASLADSIRVGIAEKDVVNKTTGERLGKVTISVGVAEIAPKESATALIERADKALYAAKKAGRNQVISDPPMGTKQSA